jgi:hypothetical protein
VEFGKQNERDQQTARAQDKQQLKQQRPGYML